MRLAVAVISVTGSMIERIKKLLIKNIDAMKISPAVSAMRPIHEHLPVDIFKPRHITQHADDLAVGVDHRARDR